MNENATPPDGGQNEPDYSALTVENASRFSLVWLIPLVALLIGAWLAYKTLSEEGPTVTILFKDAAGLEAGKTKIKYKKVEVGTVETVVLSEDLSHVVVTAKMDKHVEGQLGADTKFWVVEPQLGLSGVSGLDTLIAGHYIAVEFGKGKSVRNFNGLEHPPKISADTPGRHFLLWADNAGSLTEGTPLYFRDIKIGRVVEVNLTEDHSKVAVDVFVDAPYHLLVHDNSRFWQTSGIDVSMSAQGLSMKVGSLLSLLGGGISMDTPNLNDPKAQPSDANARFILHKDFAAIAEGSHIYTASFMMYFEDSVRGLAAGAPVEFKGIRVGTVTEVKFELNPEAKKVRIPVTIDIDSDRVLPNSEIRHYQQLYKGEMGRGRNPIFESLVTQGMRARLKTGSLLTGQLYVDLDFYPDSPPAKLVYSEGHPPELPTLPSVAEELQNSVTEILAKLKRLPLDKIGEEVLGTVQGANRLANSQDLKEAIRSLDTALKDVHQLTQTADKQIVKLSAGLEKSLGAATKVLEQFEPGSPGAVDVGNALEELGAAARSIRALSDYLERHPEALLHGKGGAKK